MTLTLHSNVPEPSPWVVRFAPLIPAAARVLDFACGGGRHARWLARLGHELEAVDRDAAALATLAGEPRVHITQADLEGGDWPYADKRFDAVVVANYLYRPRLGLLLDCLATGGVLIYETFMIGNERLGRPNNPEFLLRAGELLERVADGFTIVAFEQGEIVVPRAAVSSACVRSRGLCPLGPCPAKGARWRPRVGLEPGATPNNWGISPTWRPGALARLASILVESRGTKGRRVGLPRAGTSRA